MKSIKINEVALKALQLLKAEEGINQGEWASVIIVEALQKEYPHVYKNLKDWAIRNEKTGELTELTHHDA